MIQVKKEKGEVRKWGVGERAGKIQIKREIGKIRYLTRKKNMKENKRKYMTLIEGETGRRQNKNK